MGVGRLVMQAAAAQLTPVTLELGGKSPAIVGPGADLAQAADRIATAKGWNAGQTCIAPDYCLVPRARQADFVAALHQSVRRRWPLGEADPDYTALISTAAWARMQRLAEEATAGGATLVPLMSRTRDAGPTGARCMGPVAVLDPPADCALMREEIFGPLPPIVPYDGGVESAMAAVNDCTLHQPQHGLPFGGIGPSGMGVYHGRHGFDRFSHLKGVYLQHPLVGAVFDRWVRPPYGAFSARLLRWMLRR